MNEDQLLKNLSRAARKEAAPELDVSDLVLRRIQAGAPRVERFQAILAGTSAVAASVVFLLASQAWYSWQDPILDMALMTNTVMQ